MRDSALQKMCGELLTMGIQMNTKEVKNKIKNLRATYCQELSKIDKSTRSGAGSQEEYTSKLNWFKEMHSFIKNVPMKRKTTDSEESAVDEERTNTENLNIDNVNNDDNDAMSENFSQSTSTSNNITQRNKSAEITTKTTVPAAAKPSTSKSQLKVPETPAPKKKKIAQVATLVNEIRSLTNDLNRDHTIIPQQNEHDIFGAFVASQLKMLSSIQAITARDEINATLSRCRKTDLNYSNTTFSYQTPSHESSDTTFSIDYEDSTNVFDVITTAFKNA
nr:uncharacterized protein LOC111422050 [Onthophagus taurus]XP_022911024.1 uncharacterized protein LOC111422050 [Onthophagus taurus]